MIPNRQSLEVWGDLACFTRPELKVERFSYPVITPSAARSIFDAIYWKPKFMWQVIEIEILEPLCYIALRRNEVKDRAPVDTILQWATGKDEPAPIWADADKVFTGSDAKGRTQRQTMALKNVRYRLHAEIRPRQEFTAELPCMEAQFRRRAAAGQCIYQPYLGCREFPAFFRLCDGTETEKTIPLDMDVGWMLYDVFDLSRRGSSTDPSFVSTFKASIQNGVLKVPDFESTAVRKPLRREDDD